MPRTEARLKVSRWDDPDWLALTMDGQWLYDTLLSQAAMNHAGVLQIPRRMWSNLSADTDAGDRIAAALKLLLDGRFVLVDDETDELLVRSYIRHDIVDGPPATFNAAMACARTTRSLRLRHVLHAELLRIDQALIEKRRPGRVPEKPIDTLRRALAELDPARPGPAGTRRRTPPEPGSSPGGDGTPDAIPCPTPGVTPGVSAVGEGVRQLRSDRGSQRARQLAATAHSPQAHRLLTQYATGCAQRPPTDVLSQLGPRIDGLLTDGYTDQQVTAALAEWHRKGLAPSVLPSVAHALANGAQRQGPGSVAGGPDGLTNAQVDEILGTETGPLAPREIEDGDPAERKEWYVRETRAWREKRRQQAQVRLDRRAAG